MAKNFMDKMKGKAADNPAMMFISQPDADQEEAPQDQERPRESTPLQAPRAPQRGEAKTRRLQLLLKPSLYEAVKARAEAEGLSVNEEIGELLKSALQM